MEVASKCSTYARFTTSGNQDGIDVGCHVGSWGAEYEVFNKVEMFSLYDKWATMSELKYKRIESQDDNWGWLFHSLFMNKSLCLHEGQAQMSRFSI